MTVVAVAVQQINTSVRTYIILPHLKIKSLVYLYRARQHNNRDIDTYKDVITSTYLIIVVDIKAYPQRRFCHNNEVLKFQQHPMKHLPGKSEATSVFVRREGNFEMFSLIYYIKLTVRILLDL